MKLAKAFITASLVMLTASCGDSIQSSQSKLGSAIEKKPLVTPVVNPKSEIRLDAGEYLVKISSPESCSPNAFNVKQYHEYKFSGSKSDLTIHLNFDQAIFDNWNYATVCRDGENTGTAVIHLGKKTTIKVKGDTQIASVEKIATADVTVNKASAELQGKQDYVIEMESAGSCRDNIAFLSSKIWYADAEGVRANDVTTFSASSHLVDNLAWAMMCRMIATDRSWEYVSVDSNAMTLQADKTLQAFKINKVRTITSRTAIAVK